MATTTVYDKINDILQVKEMQAGGFYAMEIIPLENVIDIAPYNPTHGTIAYVTKKANAPTMLAYFSPNKRGFKEEQKDGDGGPYMSITINCFTPFESISNHLSINSMKYHKYILLLYFPSNGPGGEVWRIVGNLENPAVFAHTYDSGAGFKDTPGTSMVFTWQNEDKAPVFAPQFGTVVAPGGGGAGGAGGH